jgi:hypothetical protein
MQPPLEDDEAGTLRVTLTNAPTLRRQTFLTRAQRSGALGVRVQVKADGAQEWFTFGLGELGTDAVALVASSWLVGPGSVDFEGALNLLVAEMLMRHSSTDDAVVLVALAGAPRCVTPAGETSIRRALLAITGQPHEIVDVELLAPLARAVGLDELVGSSRPLAAGG